eukprot:TRINITY_DN27229_c0_g1_i1.p1 TRINITY_DN27229_c0_g1~~TRINITY_DN27229_c0_g1_i1.p1  ORF type:complete len:468 (+),score=105.10 TRINITY_DN27229_c0_g1_i1:58-1404(+)
MDAAASLLRLLQAGGWVSGDLRAGNRSGRRGVLASRSIPAGAVLMQLPDRLLLQPLRNISVDTTLEPANIGGFLALPTAEAAERSLARLAASLLAAHVGFSNSAKATSGNVLSTWRASLPSRCPATSVFALDDLGVSLLETAWSSRRAGRVRTSVLAELARLAPEVPEARRRWAACMAASRAFEHPEAIIVMAPGVDLMNHGSPLRQNVALEHVHGHGFRGRRVRATRDLQAGEELLYPYHGPQEGLSSYLWQHGFTPEPEGLGLLEWRLLPQTRQLSGAAWTALGCDGFEASHVELRAAEQLLGAVSEAAAEASEEVVAVAAALRCARLWHYDDSEAYAASAQGHFDDGVRLRPVAVGARPAWLLADVLTAESLLNACEEQLLPEHRVSRRAELAASAATRRSGLTAATAEVWAATQRELAAMSAWCGFVHGFWALWSKALQDANSG